MTLVETPDRLPTTLAEREAIIESGLHAFLDVGRALIAIKADRQYREAGHATFEDYCANRFAISKSRAYQLVAAAATYGALAEAIPETSTIVDTPLPERESQIRPLASVPDDKKLEAWQHAVDAADGEQPTAAQVEDAVKIVTGVAASVNPPTPVTPPPASPIVATPVADVEPAITLPGPTVSEQVLSAITSVYRGLLNRWPADTLAGDLDHDVVDSADELARAISAWAADLTESNPRKLRAVQGGKP